MEAGQQNQETTNGRPGHRRHRSSQGFLRHGRETYSHAHFRVYKRRWFGLAQLVLLNIVVSWDWLTFAPISATAAEYFDVSETAINWLSTGFLFAFVVISPVTIYTLHRGPKHAILWSSAFLLVGNWIRYIGTRVSGGNYGVVLFGQIVTGLAQPFVLAAPTRYSDLWFTERGRVSATALASLANPFGGALAQLINPLLPTVPSILLLTTLLSTLSTLPSLFLPSAPPTPPTHSSTLAKPALLPSLKSSLLPNPTFYLLLLTFATYVGLFNAFSSLLNQFLYPYAYTEDQAGICGALLILVGLATAACTSPLFDRTHAYLLGIKTLCPLVSLAYLAFVWAPQTRGLPAPYILAAVLGASSFALLPLSLEYLVEVTWPASPEVGSTMCWAGGQLFGGIFIVVMNALKEGESELDGKKGGKGEVVRVPGGDRPPGNMYRALVFQACVAMVVLPCPLALGVKRLGLAHEKGRLRMDEAGEGEGEVQGGGNGVARGREGEGEDGQGD
ncbi:MFS general substrate transporter [Westerdykella ornata]|uniref:MFS general substrate transporter n=1 Tax=Westerdykella ornata TaxID=318751 RepID=A0A6A6JM41_WESOR|nr:MFS general substrate transporter [Westerdykella ornata]KAF2276726.1 MFS general substrate transporter [Westerdykella ornata]